MGGSEPTMCEYVCPACRADIVLVTATRWVLRGAEYVQDAGWPPRVGA